MVRCSNTVIGILNFLTFIVSIPILYAGIWLRINGSNDCERLFTIPIITIGLFLLVVSLIGFVGSCCRVTWLLWLYLLVMFLVIIIIFGFTIFTLVMGNKGMSEALSDKGYEEYRVGDHSGWLQKKVNNTEIWNKIKTCMQATKMCSFYKYKSLMDLVEKSYYEKLLMVQSGCCKPPNDCNFTYQTPSMWNKPTNATYTNPDCDAWNNDSNIMCYNCESCKTSFMKKLKTDLMIMGIVSVIFIFFLSILFWVGCCALSNNRRNKWKRY